MSQIDFLTRRALLQGAAAITAIDCGETPILLLVVLSDDRDHWDCSISAPEGGLELATAVETQLKVLRHALVTSQSAAN